MAKGLDAIEGEVAAGGARTGERRGGRRQRGSWAAAASVAATLGAALGLLAPAVPGCLGAPQKIGFGELTRPLAFQAVFRTCSLCSENAELMSFLRERVEPGGFGGQVRVKWVRGEEPELSVVGENMAQLAVYHVGKMGAPEVVQLLAEWGFSAREVPVEGVSGRSQAPGVGEGRVDPGAEGRLRGSGADGGEGDAPRLQALRSSLQAFPL